MNYRDIQHRFANKQAGKNGRISSGNVRYEGRNYYSYNTVFGQWADVEKNVCISTTTRRFATRQTFVEKRGTSVRTYTLTSYTNVVCKSYSNKY